MDAAREGRLGGDDFIDSHYLVDEAAQRANDLRQEAERQVRYASPSGQTARAVGTFAAEAFTPYGTAVDAQDTYQLWGEGRYGAATGMAALTRYPADGRQMSNDWVTNERLRDAGITDPAERDRILKSLKRGNGRVDKYLIRTKPDGSMTARALDSQGYVSGTQNGF